MVWLNLGPLANTLLTRQWAVLTEIGFSPVGWGCRIHRLHLCTGVRPPPLNECPVYDTKQYDGEAPVLLELWEMRNTLSLQSLPGSLWSGVVAPGRILVMSQIQLFDIYMCTNKWLIQNLIVWNRTVWSFNCVLTNEWFLIELLVVHNNACNDE